MLEIKVLPDGKLWTWRLRQKGRTCIARKNVSVKKKVEARRSAERMADMLRGEGVEVDLQLGYINRCWCAMGTDCDIV